MATLELPLPTNEEPHFVITMQLEGQSYLFNFDWNSRTEVWTISITNTDGTAVIEGQTLAVGLDILRTIPNTLDHVPPGQLVCVAPSDDPGLEDIGDAFLLYFESE